MNVCMYVRMYVCMHVCMYTYMRMYVCMYVCMHACMYTYMRMYVCMYVCIASACCVSMCTFVHINPSLSPRSRCARFPSRAFRVSIRTFVPIKQVNRVPTLPEAQTSQDSIGFERVCDGLRAVIRCSVAALQLRQYLYCCASKASKLSTAESDTSGQVVDRSAFPIATKNSTSMSVESRDSVRSAVFRLSRAAAMTAAPSERMQRC
jgi:hypothetical protein